MFCKYCGRKIDDDSLFCAFCGVKQSFTNRPTVDIKTSAEAKDEIEPAVREKSSSQVQPRLFAENIQAKNSKYDNSYVKENDALYFGIFLLMISLIIAVVRPIKFESEDSYNQFGVIISIGALFLRIIVVIWVVNIAKRQNREYFGWGIFAFILPSIALIVIGQLKKLNMPTYKQILSEETLDVSFDYKNVKLSKLPEAKLTVKDVIQGETTQLIEYLKGYPESLWYKNIPGIVPIYIFQELVNRGVAIDEEMQIGLNEFAENEGFSSFSNMIKRYQ